jgi:hypothetical protein
MDFGRLRRTALNDDSVFSFGEAAFGDAEGGHEVVGGDFVVHFDLLSVGIVEGNDVVVQLEVGVGWVPVIL